MKHTSKRIKEAKKSLDAEKVYSLDEAIDTLNGFPKVEFDETVELHFYLNVNPKSSDQAIRGTVVLPNGTGRKVKIAVICKGELEQQAKDAGADFVGSQELIDKINKGFLGFDVVIATPDMMRDLSKLGKVLGPRGLMPTPKAGTVTQDVVKAIEEVKKGKVEFKTDKQAGVHIGVGKISFSKDKILQNANQIIDAINQSKPASVKGNLIRNLSISTTMGPGLKVSL